MRLAARLALVALGIGGALLLAEGLLQAAALGVRLLGREEPAAAASDRVRVLCLGDSNTYGLWLDPEDSYPRQLAAMWNQPGRMPRLEVLNAGLPGVNSSGLRRELPRMLETFRPDLVLVMVGANDFWTVPIEDAREETSKAPGVVDFVRRHSRLYRLWRTRFGEAPELEIEVGEDGRSRTRGDHRVRFGDEEFQLGFERAEEGLEVGGEQLEENLFWIVGHAREAGVPLALMTYPGRFGLYAAANVRTRRAALVTGVPLVDLALTFQPLCPRQECPDWLFRDLHPKARGYGVVARTLLGRLPQLLPASALSRSG